MKLERITKQQKRVALMQLAYVERKTQREQQEPAQMMSDFLGLRKHTPQAHLLRERVCSRNIWQAVLKKTNCPMQKEKAKRMIRKENSFLEAFKKLISKEEIHRV